ncbi:hypothetical protein BDB00DRAFT_928826 [Zychaea mexicana]|uniref:uncharacterized protein n=1 Tax=Zychaea mexicana TaxID=64656 RepID=UPI0022FEB7DE|nr:uncharacterized protein BDB00DRAFT_928826 [Zychaea mexicana]KAI9493695.1 hypothetical protein BDB00DRAFT_928826 [Zychaea mexicana]
MATTVASAANNNSSDPPGTTATTATTTTHSTSESLHGNEHKLWKIIKKQRLVIQDLQKALAEVTADRDNLLTRYNNYKDSTNTAPTAFTAMRPSVQHDRCDSLMDDDGVVMLSSSHSSSSSNSSNSNNGCPQKQHDQHHHPHHPLQQQPQGPTPPPRSPYRQHLKEDNTPHRVDSLCDNNSKSRSNSSSSNSSSSRKDVSVRSSSLPVATASIHANSRPISPGSDQTIVITSPVNAIMDKDAQLFARYQESQKRDGVWKVSVHRRNNNTNSSSNNSNGSSDDPWLWPPAAPSPPPPPPPPPSPPAHQKKTQQPHQHRHVRRASSQPAISTAQKKAAAQISNNGDSSAENSLAGINVKVLGSNITTNTKGKGVILFTISVRKDMDDMARELWRIEKLYSDFLALDSKLKSQSRPRTGKISKLPDKALFATHTPNKADQRKMAIEKYLQHMIGVPWHNASALFDFLSSNRVDRKDDACQVTPGRKEGYLTKRGKSFGGGWKTRYFVLDGPSLRFYESRDGALLGTIHIPDTQIARQHAQSNTQTSAEMRHAFLIVEPKKLSSPTSGVNRHLLCAESDEERDQWVDALTQYLNWGGGGSPTTLLDPASCKVSGGSNNSNNANNSSNSNSNSNIVGISKQLSTTRHHNQSRATSPTASRKVSKDDIKPISAMPLSQLNSDLDQNKKFASMIPSPPYYHPQRSNSADSSAVPFSDSETVPVFERPPLRQRSSMDHAYFPAVHKKATATISSARRGSLSNDGHESAAASTVSMGDIGGDGKKKKGNRRTFWAKKIFAGDMTTSMPSTNSIRGFLTRNSSDSSADQQPTSPSSQHGNGNKAKKPHVFGVPLEEAIRISRISDKCELPAIVYRCIEYLEAKNATQEEGIYRLSGSAVKIKSLKQQFDQDVDINLLESDEYHDIHAVAGLLKLWLRELPGNVLTLDLLKEFLPVIGKYLVDRDERIKELGRLVSMLPLANYTLLRILCAHLIRIIQYADTNKMNARNVGIIFSPTLQIPAGIFSLFLSEFEYIFWTNNDTYESNKLLIPSPADVNEDEEQQNHLLHHPQGEEDDDDDDVDRHSEYLSGPLHPTQPIPRPRPSSGRLQQMLHDEQGRSNRNSVHYMDGTPSSIVGLESGNAIIADDDDDVEDLELDDDTNSDDGDDYDENDDYTKRSAICYPSPSSASSSPPEVVADAASLISTSDCLLAMK